MNNLKPHDDEYIDDEYDEDEESEEEFSSCYSWCGNPAYPKCMDSCKLHDD